MNDVLEMKGARVLVIDSEGAPVAVSGDVLDLIAEASGAEADWVALPASRLGADFFELKTRFAGELLQKFVNYRFRLAIVGDVSEHVSRSVSFRDFVREANRGTQLWFVATVDDLRARLAAG